MGWKITVKYKDGGEIRISSGKKHCPIGYYEGYWANKNHVESAILQYYPKKENAQIDLLRNPCQ